MRGGGSLAIPAGVAVLASGCGTTTAQAAAVAAAAANTAGSTARLAETTTMRMQGMSLSFTETGAFDFAHSRGVLRMRGPGPMAAEELFIPPMIYVKFPGRAPHSLPSGKSWIGIKAGDSAGLGESLFGSFGGGANPADLLLWLKAVSTSVTKLGSATIRGVQVTHYRVTVDPARGASKAPRWERAEPSRRECMPSIAGRLA